MQNKSDNSPIRVLATLEAKEETRLQLKNILVSLVNPAREEEGNVSYDLYRSTENPNEFLFDEVWSNKAAFDKHYQSTKSQKDRDTVSRLLVTPLKIKTYIGIDESK
jgi:quinol monooxygenase YgiN